MIICKRVRLGDNNYFVKIKCSYDNERHLHLLDGSNYDDGNLSLLISEIEEKYDRKFVYNKYGSDVSFISDCLYIFDNIPFIDGVGELNSSSVDDVIFDASYISRDELKSFLIS